MNGENGGIKIDVSLSPNAVLPGFIKRSTRKKSFLRCKWILEAWAFAKEDINRVTFSFKVGLAMLLVSLLALVREPFRLFGTNIIWSILTVAIMFEYTVGATFNRGFNRAVGSMIAGICAIMVIQIALSSGGSAGPYIIGLSIFLVGAVTSFMKQWPSLVPYEYGFRVILFTYCLIIVSDYRMGNPITTAVDRLYSIAIGGVVALLVNALVFPIWAGEQLHKELVGSFTAVADSLEECVKMYLRDGEADDHCDGFLKATDDIGSSDEPAIQKCQATLNASARLDSLANSAKWEPPHGRFRLFFFPWSQYVRVGAVLRHCAYEVVTMNGCLHSEIQAPHVIRMAFQSEIQEAGAQAVELVRSLGSDIDNMKHTLQRLNLLKNVHNSIYNLQLSLELQSYLLTSTPSLSDSYTKPTTIQFSNSLSLKLKDNSDQTLPTNPNGSVELTAKPTAPSRSESYHESMRKQQRRRRSWPSREVDDLEEDGAVDSGLVMRMRALESTAALSLVAFASLLVEFVARLDHLVDVVDELSKLAKFKEEEGAS